jgi:ribosomal protein S18 acetylase RimI-like enzyme
MRPPTLTDVPAILALVHASDIAAIGEPDYTTDDVVEVLTAPNFNPELDSWLAFDADGRLLGWAYISNHSGGSREFIDVFVHPQYGQPVQAELFRLALERVPHRARELGHAEVTVRAAAIASERDWIGVIEEAGFGFLKRYARMARELGDADVPPAIPPGVVIRTLRPEDETEMRAFYDVLRGAFADIPDSMSGGYEEYLARIASLPSISWDEWFVAEIDGVVVGALQSAGAEDNEGWVRNLGVAAAYRGRGLGRLLLQTAFAAYRSKGRTSAGLGVDLTNPTSAYRLYTGVGMRPAYESDIYERTLPASSSGPIID